MKFRITVILFFFISIISKNFAQGLEGKWINQTDTTIQNIPVSYLNLKEGDFEFKKTAPDTVISGSYLLQNKNLVLLVNQYQNSILSYKVESLTDSTLILRSRNEQMQFYKEDFKPVTMVQNQSINIIQSSGFSFTSFYRGTLGMLVLLALAYLVSSNRKAINWKTVGVGLAAQLLLAIGVLKVPVIQELFNFIGKIFNEILLYTQAGSEFLLGGMMDVESYGFIFLFQVLPTIIFFSALTSILFYFGIIQVVVKGMAWVLTKLMGISGAESLSVAGNIFLGQTEAPLMIKAYLERMNQSEILLVMIGGMATVAGGVLAAYIGFLGGNDEALRLEFARHLLAASVMAAPGAIVVSKILYPQTEAIESTVEVTQDKIGANILDAISNGTTEGLRLAANVGAMLLVFVALIAMLNGMLGWIGGFTGLNTFVSQNTPYASFSLEAILGTLFAPLMWLIGVAKEDMMLMGQLLGIKLAASEFIGYIQLAELKDASSALHLTYNKSIIMATYMLCGFANFASIGIQIGGIGSLAPGKRKTLSEFGLKALIGGTIASLLSATLAGMIIG